MSVDDLQLGSTYPGKVVSVVPFGAFVDIGDSSARLARFERREAKPICLLPSFTAPRREPTSFFLNVGALLYLQGAGLMDCCTSRSFPTTLSLMWIGER